MIDQDPTNWDGKTWALILAMSSMGGFVNWVSRYRRGNVVSMMELIGELATSASVGVTAFMILTAYGYPMLTCVAAASVSGHLATRIIFALQAILTAKQQAIIDDIKRGD